MNLKNVFKLYSESKDYFMGELTFLKPIALSTYEISNITRLATIKLLIKKHKLFLDFFKVIFLQTIYLPYQN